jgi:hypothetical protein
MNKLAGITALIVGILGVLAAGFEIVLTLSPMPYQRLIVGLSMGCCIAIAVTGATLIKRKSRAMSGLLMVLSIVGAMIVMGDNTFMVLMALALVGGILGLISAGNMRPTKLTDDASPARFTTNNRLIWLLAIAPLIAAMISVIVAEVFGISLWLTMLVLLNVGLGFCDLGLLESTGLDVSRLHAGTVFLVPWYIYRRQRATRQHGYLATWLGSFVLFFVVLAVWPYAATSYGNYQLRTSGIVHSAQVHSVLTYHTVSTNGARAMVAEPAPAGTKPVSTDTPKRASTRSTGP